MIVGWKMSFADFDPVAAEMGNAACVSETPTGAAGGSVGVNSLGTQANEMHSIKTKVMHK